ncbi:MAG TPA: flagellar basal body-associated FliL family protein [Rhizobiaceae bacterium]
MAPAPDPVAAAAQAAPKSGPSMVVQLGALVVMTLAAAGTGWVSGGFMVGGGPGGESAAHAPAAGGGKGGASALGEQPAASETVIPLGAITTSVASPGDTWVRMEVSIVLDEPQDGELPGLIQQDLLSYIRTVKMHEIEGASGFRHLKENLEERAAIRSDGHVKQVLIRTLLFE